MGEGLRHVRPVDNEVSSQGEDGGEEKGSGRSVRPQSAPDEGAERGREGARHTGSVPTHYEKGVRTLHEGRVIQQLHGQQRVSTHA